MITQDLQLVKQIFELLDAGIVEGYDSFCYEVVVSVGYMETVLTVEKEGVRVTDAETDYNGAILYRLVKELRECATRTPSFSTVRTVSIYPTLTTTS